MTRDERIAVSVTPEMKRRFRAEAGRRDMDMSDLLHHIMTGWMEEHEGEELDQGNLMPKMASSAAD